MFKSLFNKRTDKENRDLFESKVKQVANEKAKSILEQYGFLDIQDSKKDDIFIVGYPKSGNTWVQFMMTSLIYQIHPRKLNLSIVLEFVPDVHYKKVYKRYNEQCFFKSHDYPLQRQRKVVYLVRDGRDAMVSYYHMNKAQSENYSMSEMILEGKGLFPGRWFEHVKVWMENPYSAQILVVKYEDLKKDTLQEIKRICNFCGIQVPDEWMRTVIDGCSFEKLKNLEAKQGLKDGAYKWTGGRDSRFFRKGQIGSFKEEMNDELLRFFEMESHDQLTLMGYK